MEAKAHQHSKPRPMRIRLAAQTLPPESHPGFLTTVGRRFHQSLKMERAQAHQYHFTALSIRCRTHENLLTFAIPGAPFITDTAFWKVAIIPIYIVNLTDLDHQLPSLWQRSLALFCVTSVNALCILKCVLLTLISSRPLETTPCECGHGFVHHCRREV